MCSNMVNQHLIVLDLYNEINEIDEILVKKFVTVKISQNLNLM